MDTNNQVVLMWKQQSEMLEKTPEMAAEHVAVIQAHLGNLHNQAEGNEEAQAIINSIWGKVQGMNTLMIGQTTVLASAGIIIPALKVQRDELALELAQVLEKLGLSNGKNPVEGMLSALYDSWRDTLDTEDIEATGQDELLEAIKGDIEGQWGLPEGWGETVLMVLRGHEEISSRSADLFIDFLNSVAQDQANL